MLTKAEVQRLRGLRDKKAREAEGVFVVEGEKVVAELLGAGVPLLEVYTTAAWQPPTPAARTSTNPPVSPRVITLAADEMARISHFPTPSSVLAVGRITRRLLAAGDLDSGFTLALDGVQDAGNVGTLLRIADWFGFARVLLSPDSADLFNQKVINASMGSFARMAAHTVDLPAALAAVSSSTPILGCDLTGKDVHALPRFTNAIVVIGSEGRGLSPAVSALVRQRVTIPRIGQAESLNAAVAAAIVCDNLRRAAT